MSETRDVLRAATVVNGNAAGTAADPDEPLVDYLRDGLGLTGTKPACGSGACGACTVLVDGTPKVSCLTPGAAVCGRSVTTVEGLDGHPVQRAFAAADGLQCGYCTPGFVVEAAAFTDRWRAEHGAVAPPRSVIAAAMAGHLCRCGAYPGIYAAIAAACAEDAEPVEPVAGPPRVEAWEKVTGRARYTTDVRLPGQLEGVLIRSTRPHARVGTIHAGGATLAELLPADRMVRYVGQPVAAVAGPTRALALASAARVRVEYAELPAVLDVTEAAEHDAAPVYPARSARRAAPRHDHVPAPARWRGNLRATSALSWRRRTADRRLAAARRRGDPNLVTGTFSTAAQSHTALEPHACVAHWGPDGDLTLHVSTQAVGAVAEEAAKRWSASRVDVVAEHVGGGFGAKAGVTGDVVAAVELARVTGAPVRVVLSRAEELVDGGNRPATRTELALLADRAGNLSALSIEVHSDGGTAIGAAVAAKARLMYGRAPRRLRDVDVVTNMPPATAFRGPGGAPLHWAMEQAVDEAAHRLGTDPIDLRRRWDGNPKRHALYDWAAGLPVWADRPVPGSQHGRFRRGVGMAAANWMYLLDPATEVELVVERGGVVVRTTTQDIGTGSRTVLAEVVSAELGLRRDRVRVEIGRTAGVHGPPALGSRSTAWIGPAARDGADRLRTALRVGPGAADESVLQALERADGLRVVGRRGPDRRRVSLPFAVGDMPVPGRGFSGAVHVTEVSVDTLLGTTRVLRVWAGLAIGRVYAERPARNQCEGGVVQGIGYALFEQRETDPATGIVLTDNLEDYRIAGIGDSPEIDVHFHPGGWEHVDGHGVGLGEVCTIGVAASIGNAVHNATGWRPHDLPIRPERLLAGLDDGQAGR